jgi:hypoxanthine-guanine phosphoribosyltransferase
MGEDHMETTGIVKGTGPFVLSSFSHPLLHRAVVLLDDVIQIETGTTLAAALQFVPCRRFLHHLGETNTRLPPQER